MVSGDRRMKASAREYAETHGVKYTDALRAVTESATDVTKYTDTWSEWGVNISPVHPPIHLISNIPALSSAESRLREHGFEPVTYVRTVARGVKGEWEVADIRTIRQDFAVDTLRKTMSKKLTHDITTELAHLPNLVLVGDVADAHSVLRMTGRDSKVVEVGYLTGSEIAHPGLGVLVKGCDPDSVVRHADWLEDLLSRRWRFGLLVLVHWDPAHPVPASLLSYAREFRTPWTEVHERIKARSQTSGTCPWCMGTGVSVGANGLMGQHYEGRVDSPRACVGMGMVPMTQRELDTGEYGEWRDSVDLPPGAYVRHGYRGAGGWIREYRS